MSCLLQGSDRHSQGKTNHKVSGSIRSGELNYVCIYYSFQPCEKRAENQKKPNKQKIQWVKGNAGRTANNQFWLLKYQFKGSFLKGQNFTLAHFFCFVKSVLDQCRIFMHLHISLLSKLLSVSLSECWFVIKSVNPFTFSCFIHFRGFKSSLLGRCLLIISLKPKELLSIENSSGFKLFFSVF